jgi:hypothetical protein
MVPPGEFPHEDVGNDLAVSRRRGRTPFRWYGIDVADRAPRDLYAALADGELMCRQRRVRGAEVDRGFVIAAMPTAPGPRGE